MEPERQNAYVGRLHNLVALKDYAVSRGYPLSDIAIEEIASLEQFLTNDQTSKLSQKEFVQIDKYIRDLSAITYPINIDNLERILEGKGITRFAYLLLLIGLSAAVLAGIFIGMIKSDWYGEWVKSELAISLGVVGAVIYVMLPNGRLNFAAGLDNESVATNLIRVCLGGVLGFVIYVVNPDFLAAKPGSTVGLLAPLVGGYSISLAVGVLGKAVTAIELTLNLDEKRTQASLKR
jgi:hypothetical protein